MSTFLKPVKQPEKTEFWCEKCDSKLVDSLVHGHTWRHESGQYDGEYTEVMFALCNDCLNESQIKPQEPNFSPQQMKYHAILRAVLVETGWTDSEIDRFIEVNPNIWLQALRMPIREGVNHIEVFRATENNNDL